MPFPAASPFIPLSLLLPLTTGVMIQTCSFEKNFLTIAFTREAIHTATAPHTCSLGCAHGKLYPNNLKDNGSEAKLS